MPGGKRNGAGRPEAIKFMLTIIYQGCTSAELKQGFYLLGTLPAVGSSGLSGYLAYQCCCFWALPVLLGGALVPWSPTVEKRAHTGRVLSART